MIRPLLLAAALWGAAGGGAQAQPAGDPVATALVESTRCLRMVERDPALGPVTARMPNPDRMGVANIDDKAMPTNAERGLLRRYREEAERCAPRIDISAGGKAAAVAAVLEEAWTQQTANLDALIKGGVTWGDYNRRSMRIDQSLRRGLAALRKR